VEKSSIYSSLQRCRRGGQSSRLTARLSTRALRGRLSACSGARLLVTWAGCRLSSSCSAIYGEDDAPCPSRVEVEFLGFGKADTACNSGWWQRLSTPLQAGAQIIPMITGSSLFSSTVKILRPIYRISRHMYKVLNIN
jgi:hypothetical protein